MLVSAFQNGDIIAFQSDIVIIYLVCPFCMSYVVEMVILVKKISRVHLLFNMPTVYKLSVHKLSRATNIL